MSNLSCSNLSYDNTLRNFFPLPLADNYIIFILFPLTIVSTAINLLFFWKVKSSRQPPADILFFGTVFGVLRMVTYFSTDIYDQIYPAGQAQPIPGNFNDFCIGTGFVGLFAQLGAFVYNMAFSILYVFKIRNPLKKWVNQNREVHIVCWLVAAIITGILYLTNQIGLSIIGVCGLRISQVQSFIGAAFTILYLIILFVTSAIFLKYLNTISKEDEKSIIFFKFYSIYLVTISIDKIIEHICWLVLGFNCNSNTPVDELYVFVTICNFTILIVPILITFIILTHPEMRWSLIKGYLKQICKKEQKLQRKSFYDELITTYRGSVQLQSISDQKKDSQNRSGLLSKIKERNRACLLSTILGCVSIHQSVNTHDASFNWNFKDRVEFTLTKDIISYYPRIFLQSLPVLQIHFIAYSPSSFNILLKQCEITNVTWQLKPINNQKEIFQNAQTDGGASGQFFFFNHSKNIIIKTINTLQLQVLTSRLKAFTQHFKKYPQSLIVRLMGVFSAVNPETYEKIHFIMMVNLLRMIPRKYALRVFDLKGSSYQRQVVKDYQKFQDYGRTLKDIDFLKLQQKIWVSNQDSARIKKILLQDASFLSSQGLIDYSLIVIKVAFNEYLKDATLSKVVNKNPKNMFDSIKQQGIVYIIGIIDFLETWNIRKRGQNWFKSIFNKSQDISSQAPAFYCERFSKNLVENIFP